MGLFSIVYYTHASMNMRFTIVLIAVVCYLTVSLANVSEFSDEETILNSGDTRQVEHVKRPRQGHTEQGRAMRTLRESYSVLPKHYRMKTTPPKSLPQSIATTRPMRHKKKKQMIVSRRDKVKELDAKVAKLNKKVSAKTKKTSKMATILSKHASHHDLVRHVLLKHSKYLKKQLKKDTEAMNQLVPEMEEVELTKKGHLEGKIDDPSDEDDDGGSDKDLRDKNKRGINKLTGTYGYRSHTLKADGAVKSPGYTVKQARVGKHGYYLGPSRRRIGAGFGRRRNVPFVVPRSWNVHSDDKVLKKQLRKHAIRITRRRRHTKHSWGGPKKPVKKYIKGFAPKVVKHVKKAIKHVKKKLGMPPSIGKSSVVHARKLVRKMLKKKARTKGFPFEKKSKKKTKKVTLKLRTATLEKPVTCQKKVDKASCKAYAAGHKKAFKVLNSKAHADKGACFLHHGKTVYWNKPFDGKGKCRWPCLCPATPKSHKRLLMPKYMDNSKMLKPLLTRANKKGREVAAKRKSKSKRL